MDVMTHLRGLGGFFVLKPHIDQADSGVDVRVLLPSAGHVEVLRPCGLSCTALFEWWEPISFLRPL